MRFWAGRKAAFPAVGRISPDYLCMDGTIPRKELPRVLAGMRALSAKHGLRVANVFHAGDGNIHPVLLFDERDSEQVRRVLEASGEILDEIEKQTLLVGYNVLGSYALARKQRGAPIEIVAGCGGGHGVCR